MNSASARSGLVLVERHFSLVKTHNIFSLELLKNGGLLFFAIYNSTLSGLVECFLSCSIGRWKV